MDIDIDSVLRMIAAVAAGSAIGFNRDIHGKPTGIRAHALVSMGAAVLMIAGSAGYAGKGDLAAPSRVLQGIVAGVGFLGAGVILRTTQGLRVFHLTTAAWLWVTTAVGVLCGIGAFELAGLATLLVLAVLVVGQRLDKWLYGLSGIKDDDRE